MYLAQWDLRGQTMLQLGVVYDDPGRCVQRDYFVSYHTRTIIVLSNVDRSVDHGYQLSQHGHLYYMV